MAGTSLVRVPPRIHFAHPWRDWLPERCFLFRFGRSKSSVSASMVCCDGNWTACLHSGQTTRLPARDIGRDWRQAHLEQMKTNVEAGIFSPQSCRAEIAGWCEKGSGTFAGTARRVLRTKVPDPFSHQPAIAIPVPRRGKAGTEILAWCARQANERSVKIAVKGENYELLAAGGSSSAVTTTTPSLVKARVCST